MINRVNRSGGGVRESIFKEGCANNVNSNVRKLNRFSSNLEFLLCQVKTSIWKPNMKFIVSAVFELCKFYNLNPNIQIYFSLLGQDLPQYSFSSKALKAL